MQPSAAGSSGSRHIQVAGLSLDFRGVEVASDAPTGEQLSAAAGYAKSQKVVVLEILENGELEDIRPTEVVGLADSTRRFVIVEADRTYLFTLDGVLELPRLRGRVGAWISSGFKHYAWLLSER